MRLETVDAERDEVVNRARDATTFLTMSFWKEMEDFGHTRVAQRLRALEIADHADAATIKALADRWRIEKQVIEDFLKLPYAAVEAAQKGDNYGR